MPARVSAWAIYDQFATRDGAKVFLGITSDRHWQRFCDAFGRDDLAADETLANNNQRIDARTRLLPILSDLVAGLDLAEISKKAIAAELPFAHIAHPEALLDDPHLNDGGYLLVLLCTSIGLKLQLVEQLHIPILNVQILKMQLLLKLHSGVYVKLQRNFKVTDAASPVTTNRSIDCFTRRVQPN